MSRLVVASNRVAPIDQDKVSAGGLAVGVLEALHRSGGVWFGWSGEVAAVADSKPALFSTGRLTYATIDLDRRQYEEYYNGFANRALWPTFHYRSDLALYSRREFATYMRVNGLFAAKLLPLLEADDLIWVHDYHLIPLGEELRRAGCEQRIGFFLHTPWPAMEVLLTLPDHRQLARAMCAYDVVGFHTEGDRRAFADYLRFEADGDVDAQGRARAFGREAFIGVFPIGIDVENMVTLADVSDNSQQTRRLEDSMPGRDLIIGVDRLDYSKGLLNRFAALERLLEVYPASRGQVTFMQIAPPTRGEVVEYADIRRELEELAGHINGRFADFDWAPIRYLNKTFNRKTLAGFYRHARIGLVTPLRDGMNLVAKEYIAAQDPDDPGVLVLSRFAGAAAELDTALIVNPHDIDAMAEAVQRGLEMSRDERIERWRAAMVKLRGNSVTVWRERFVAALEGAA